MASRADYQIAQLTNQAVPDEGYVLNSNFLSRENQQAIETRLCNYIIQQRPTITAAENRIVFKLFIKVCATVGTSHQSNFKNYAASIGNDSFNYSKMVDIILEYPGRYENVTLRKFMRFYAPYVYHAVKFKSFPFNENVFFPFEHHYNTPRNYEHLAFDFNFGIRPHQCDDRELLVLRATFQVKDNIDKEQAMLTSTSTYFHKGKINQLWNKIF